MSQINANSDNSTWRDERQARREERRAAGGGVVGALMLIAVGCAFLLNNMGMLDFGDHWWALFILIPAFGSFATAFAIYQNAGGRLTAAARGSLFGGLVLSGLACIFLFDLNFLKLWPILIIVAGVGALINGLFPR
jgi:hypothetical protein